jgi:Na+/melibiose symporter-like transporter
MLDAGGRPTKVMPIGHLVRISLYWLGISTIWSGLLNIVNGRLQFTGLVAKGGEGIGALEIAVLGMVVAIAVQPTVGTLSDYTISRWGRRKPYIFIGSSLDLIFLWGIANSNSVLAIAAFVTLLQFSSNFSQGPFQGYVPDLVPAKQVGLASGLIGLFQAFGNIVGYVVAAVAIWASKTDPNAFLYGTMALGLVEFVSMLGVVIQVDEGHRTKSRNGRSWLAIAGEAWGLDVLRERSFLWLVGSRFCVLAAASFLPAMSLFYLAQVFGLDEAQTGQTELILLAIIGLLVTISVLPASRLSDRVGRKPVIYASCVMGAAGLGIAAVAPVLPVTLVGAILFGVSAGAFLAVDWALMSEIVPKASSGRYMGISNVATASAGTFTLAFGGAVVMDNVNRMLGYGAGPRAALAFGVVFYLLGALLLVPVHEPGRDSAQAEPEPAVRDAA